MSKKQKSSPSAPEDASVMDELKYGAHRARLLELVHQCTEQMDQSGMWGIFLNGHRVFLTTGKFQWTQLRHAKVALSNQIKNHFISGFHARGREEYRVAHDAYKKLIDELQNKGILEFRQLGEVHGEEE